MHKRPWKGSNEFVSEGNYRNLSKIIMFLPSSEILCNSDGAPFSFSLGDKWETFAAGMSKKGFYKRLLVSYTSKRKGRVEREIIEEFILLLFKIVG